MKTLLDRCTPLFPADYAFRDVYLLAVAADPSETAMDATIKGLQGWIDCFKKSRLAGVIRGVGIDKSGDAAQKRELLDKVYALGQQL